MTMLGKINVEKEEKRKKSFTEIRQSLRPRFPLPTQVPVAPALFAPENKKTLTFTETR